MSKKLLAAGICRDLEFDSSDSLEVYLYSLQHRKIHFEILDRCDLPNGHIIIRLLSQYNSSELIKLFE